MFNYEIGKKVVVRNHIRSSKLDEYFLSPYKILDVKTNRLGLSYPDGLQYENIKNVRPFFKKEEYVPVDTSKPSTVPSVFTPDK